MRSPGGQFAEKKSAVVDKRKGKKSLGMNFPAKDPQNLRIVAPTLFFLPLRF